MRCFSICVATSSSRSTTPRTARACHVHVGANARSAGGTPDRAALRCARSGRRHWPHAGCTLYAAQPQDTPCRWVSSPGRFPQGPATWYACPGATLHGPQRAQWRIRFCPPLVRSAGSPRHCVRCGAAPRETTGKHHGSSGRSGCSNRSSLRSLCFSCSSSSFSWGSSARMCRTTPRTPGARGERAGTKGALKLFGADAADAVAGEDALDGALPKLTHALSA